MKFEDLFEIKLDINNKEHKGLLSWVKDYIKMRHYGNVKGAKRLKQDIDKAIKKLKLDSKEVYFYYGDPDDPGKREMVYKKVGIVD